MKQNQKARCLTFEEFIATRRSVTFKDEVIKDNHTVQEFREDFFGTALCLFTYNHDSFIVVKLNDHEYLNYFFFCCHPITGGNQVVACERLQPLERFMYERYTAAYDTSQIMSFLDSFGLDESILPGPSHNTH